MKAGLVGLALLVGGCGGGIIHHPTDSPTAVCRGHFRQAMRSNTGGFAGCYWWDWSGCHVVYGKADLVAKRHEEEHCRRGNWHPAGLTRDDLIKEMRDGL